MALIHQMQILVHATVVGSHADARAYAESVESALVGSNIEFDRVGVRHTRVIPAQHKLKVSRRVPKDRRPDVRRLRGLLSSHWNVIASPLEVHELWCEHSAELGVEWAELPQSAADLAEALGEHIELEG